MRSVPVQRSGSTSSSSWQPSAKASQTATARSTSTSSGSATSTLRTGAMTRRGSAPMIGASRSGARMSADAQPWACTTVTRLSSKAIASTLGGSSTARRRRFSSAVPRRVAASTPHRSMSDCVTCAHAGPTSIPNPAQTPGGTRRWTVPISAGNGWATRLSSGRIRGASSSHDPPISTELNASTVRRRTIGSISPPSGRNRRSRRRSESRLRRARRSALASFASRRGLRRFHARILPGDA